MTGEPRPGGVFITFEGLDGTGKSTQARRLAARLRRRGLRVVHTREPGGTTLGRRLRALVLRVPEEPLSPEAELLLLMADRAQHVARVVRPALQEGLVVVCERYADSSVAYQAFGMGIGRGVVDELNRLATGGLKPDLTVWLDLPPGQCLGRRPRAPDRIERRALDFFERVREGYRTLAEEDPGRFAVIDTAGLSREEVARLVQRAVDERLGPRLAALSRAWSGRGLGV